MTWMGGSPKSLDHVTNETYHESAFVTTLKALQCDRSTLLPFFLVMLKNKNKILKKSIPGDVKK